MKRLTTVESREVVVPQDFTVLPMSYAACKATLSPAPVTVCVGRAYFHEGLSRRIAHVCELAGTVYESFLSGNSRVDFPQVHRTAPLSGGLGTLREVTEVKGVTNR